MVTTTGTTTTETTNSVTQNGARSIWKPDPAHTHVEFSAKHMMISTVKGRFDDVDFTLHVDRNDLTNSSIEAKIGSASLKSGVEYRDNHLRSGDFLDSETHPHLIFKSTRIEQEDLNEYTITGDLTIRGVTRPVTMRAELGGFGHNRDGKEVLGFTATTQINRKEWVSTGTLPSKRAACSSARR